MVVHWLVVRSGEAYHIVAGCPARRHNDGPSFPVEFGMREAGDPKLLWAQLRGYRRRLVGDLRRPLFWCCLVIAAGLMAVGHLFSAVPIVQPLRAASAEARIALYSFDPWV